MATLVDIREDVLKKLKRFPISGTVNNSLAADVDRAITRKQAQLEGQELAYWGASVTDMPEEAIGAFVGLVAASRAEELAITPERRQLLLLRAPGHQSVIADLARVAQDDRPETAEFF